MSTTNDSGTLASRAEEYARNVLGSGHVGPMNTEIRAAWIAGFNANTSHEPVATHSEILAALDVGSRLDSIGATLRRARRLIGRAAEDTR